MNRIILCMGMSFLLLGACKDNDEEERESENNTESQLLRNIESVMTSDYFWAADARSKNIDVSTYDPDEPRMLVRAYESPSDRFTFMLTREQGGILQGTPSDAGLLLRYLHDTLFVAYVEPRSPADAAGIHRGMWVKSITRTGGETKTYTPPPADLSGSLGPSSEGQRATNLGDFEGTIVLGERGSATLETLSFSSAVYDVLGISTSKVLTIAGRKVGYFYYSTFLATESIAEMTDMFARFRSEGIQDVIIDLRYNRGGRSSFAEHMVASLFSPGADRLMYSYAYNAAIEEEFRENEWDLDIFFPSDVVSLQAERCFFLVDASTASASELVINTLKPFSQVEVYIIGKITTGKSVASWRYYLPHANINSTNNPTENPSYTHTLHPIVARFVNSMDQAVPGPGFTPDHSTFDDVRFPLGDTRETMMAAALYYIENNAWPTLPVAARRALERQPMISTRQLDGLQMPLLIDRQVPRP